VALVLSGALRVVIDDGLQQDFSKNDVMLLPLYCEGCERSPVALSAFRTNSRRNSRGEAERAGLHATTN
jgi:hypothetical protein